MEGQQDTDAVSEAPGYRSSLIDLQDAVFNSPGYRAMGLVLRVGRIGYLLQGNAAQFLDLVEQLQDFDSTLPIFDVSNPDLHDDLMSEAERLLHNFLTAMSTRVDQQRVFMNEYFADDPPLTAAYRDKVKAEFITDMPSVFLKELRNHTAHVQIPVAQSQQTFTRTSFEVTFTLPTSALLKWTWPVVLRQWIKDCGNDVMIVDVVREYAAKADAFDVWLAEQISGKYAVEIAEYRPLHEAYNREHARVFGI